MDTELKKSTFLRYICNLLYQGQMISEPFLPSTGR